MMIERIRREHGYMVRLLAILAHKLRQLKDEKPINYSLVEEIVDYLANHSEKVHHPKEDIIYHHFLKRFGDQETISDLEHEHQTLSVKTHEFLDIVQMILQDAVVPQDIFISKLEAFIHDQRHHLELEERSILPLIEKRFLIADWQAVENKWSQSEDDPVFGDTIADRYKQLAERVRQSDSESV
ncbi:hemerythrin domain-containing protein [Vibrio sp. ZSDZ34]|jgi:hemerythrin-like domain-containing protein|uniref:Hemerythrin domain-containing protein n=1 Tax=Vibrio gelatinilyticus TaxID=2893468 RepID=A0A9X2AXS4_9VIBR|nr:hemerythrin domain-containing protein [Vibrio gelatinilyticus]MCJ2375882.1 hemerythrin domain-containing protein [Vibrio gelatinilyticus]